MVVSVLKYGEPILRSRSTEIGQEEDSAAIIANLFDTLKKEGGVGLAAPQIGIPKRIFIIDTLPLHQNEDSVDEIQEAYLNPVIIWKSPHQCIYREGCLSIPGLLEDVERSERIKVIYQDEGFCKIEKEIEGIHARIFQHEYDHLEGILFIDRISMLRRKFISGRLNKIKNQRNNIMSWIKAILLKKQNYLELRTLS